MKRFCVYILASEQNGTLYIGVTSDLPRRMTEHREKLIDGFTSKYGVARLVHYEPFDSADAAFTRETQLKKWRRKWKLRLIETENPDWEDLYERLNQ